jgi:hypothetical protein
MAKGILLDGCYGGQITGCSFDGMEVGVEIVNSAKTNIDEAKFKNCDIAVKGTNSQDITVMESEVIGPSR